MKKRIIFLIIIIPTIIFLALGVKAFKDFNSEIIDVDNFTRYYESTDEESGGFEVLSSNYLTIERVYKLSKGKEIKVNESYNVNEKFEVFEIPKLKEYIVKAGDNLSKIASENNQSLSVIKANNPKLGSVLKIGDKIKIATANGIFYEVVSGDSMFKLAQRFGVKTDVIMKYNKLSSSSLRIKQKLYIHEPDFKKVASDLRKRSTIFKMPVTYKGITSPFGKRMHPVLKRYIYHKGVDMRAQYVNLYASRSGTVTFAGWMSGYGKLLIIKHSGGYETRSAHLTTINVKKGQKVNQGDLVGKTGMSGRVTGPHLHFEIRKNGNPLNPMKYLAK